MRIPEWICPSNGQRCRGRAQSVASRSAQLGRCWRHRSSTVAVVSERPGPSLFVRSGHNHSGALHVLSAPSPMSVPCHGPMIADETRVNVSVTGSAASLVTERDYVAVLRTLPKTFGLAGLCCSFGLAPP